MATYEQNRQLVCFYGLILGGNHRFRRKRRNILSINILRAERKFFDGMFFVALRRQIIYPDFAWKKKQRISV